MKRFLILVLSFLLTSSFVSCGGKHSDIDSSDKELSSQSVSTSEIQSLPKEKMSHEPLDDGNYYLKVQTISGEYVCIREIAAKGSDFYSSVREGDNFEWYYSNGRATFSFDDDKKVYEIYSLNSLAINLFAGEKVSEGECVFFNVACSYVKYKLDDKVSILHMYRNTDNSWVGFQYMYNDGTAEANIVLESSDNYPSHAVFSIPDDYTYYFEQGDNEVTMDWD